MQKQDQQLLNPLNGFDFSVRGQAADALTATLDPLIDALSPGRARLVLSPSVAHYGKTATEMEGVCRALWGLAPLLAGGGTWAHADQWLTGVLTGTDPDSAEFWGWPSDFDQRWVEAAAIGLTLMITPASLMDLGKPADNLINWLSRINNHKLHPNNWLFFRVLVNLGLRSVGAAWSKERVNEDLAILESFEDPDGGWFSDGKAHQRDYYIAWAMHFYSLLISHWASDVDPGFTERARLRAHRFADSFEHWFADDGSALPFGRSLAYRTAQAAFWPALATDASRNDCERAKRIWTGNLSWWASRPITGRDHVLSIGYAYPSPIMGEQYNSPTSPYWALKAFLPLALDETHPFWTCHAKVVTPTETIDIQRGGRIIIARCDGDVSGYPTDQASGSRHRHGAAKYGKFAYSTRFGFCTPGGNEHITDLAPDNALALSESDSWWRARHHQTASGITPDGCVWSRWEPWKDVSVQSFVIPLGAWHIRLHRINSARALRTVEGGWACPSPGTIQPPVAGADGTAAWSSQPKYYSVITAQDARLGDVVRHLPSLNVLHPLVDIPVVVGDIEHGQTDLLSIIGGASTPLDQDAAPIVHIRGDRLELEDRQQGTTMQINLASPDGAF